MARKKSEELHGGRAVGVDLFRQFDYKKEKDVGSGAWVLVKCNIPVDKAVRPQIYGIYWALPAEDSFGRQKVKIYTPTEVCLLNYEYTVISEEHLNEYKKMGYYLRDYSLPKDEPLNMTLIQKGRSLTEEEREVIWALQLDGLSEQQACEEYFYSHHTDFEHKGCCYLPTKELLDQIIAVFGEKGIAG